MEIKNGYQILPGTLYASVLSKQMAAIELGISLGKEVQNKFPQVGQLYKDGLTLSKLVYSLNLTSHFGVKFKVAESAVYRALRGYSGYLKNLYLEPYPGLLSEEELTSLGKEHNRISGAETGKEAVEKKKGIFAITFTKEQREAAIMKSIIACGNVPYSEEEICFIEELAADPQYQKGSLTKVAKIAYEVNLKFHNGEKIRRPRAISQIRLRQRDKKALTEKSEE